MSSVDNSNSSQINDTLGTEFSLHQKSRLYNIFNKSKRIFVLLSDNPQIDSECLDEIYKFISDEINLSEHKENRIIGILNKYIDYTNKNGIKCSPQRIRYGLYSLRENFKSSCIDYIMNNDFIKDCNIGHIYECFKHGVTLEKFEDTVKPYSYLMYTTHQIELICLALVDVSVGLYSDQFIEVMKACDNASEMSVIRNEAIRLTTSLDVINKISKHRFSIKDDINK